eukprot:GHVT01005744.1.p1 GENE.GHVT01005744.1~~GHVT01005744.1.p1  ORF type:complete len:181 (+),score=16.73 GHVT01005744.1:322-864(+)
MSPVNGLWLSATTAAAKTYTVLLDDDVQKVKRIFRRLRILLGLGMIHACLVLVMNLAVHWVEHAIVDLIFGIITVSCGYYGLNNRNARMLRWYSRSAAVMCCLSVIVCGMICYHSLELFAESDGADASDIATFVGSGLMACMFVVFHGWCVRDGYAAADRIEQSEQLKHDGGGGLIHPGK